MGFLSAGHRKQLAKASAVPQTLDLVNLVNSSRGINGLAFDIQDLAGTPGRRLSRMSPTGVFDPERSADGWSLPPLHRPLRWSRNTGSGTYDWADNAIANRWLQECQGQQQFGLAAPEIYGWPSFGRDDRAVG